MSKPRPTLTVSVGLATAILGALAGFFLQALIKGSISRALAGGLLAVSLVCIVLLLRIGEDAAGVKRLVDEGQAGGLVVLSHLEQLQREESEAEGRSISRLSELSELVRKQMASAGFSVFYLKTSTVSMQYNPVYDLMTRATRSIYLLDLYYEDSRADLTLGAEVLGRSMQAMIDLTSRNGTYERIVQYKTGDVEEFSKVVEGTFGNHYAACLRADKPNLVVHLAPETLPLKFSIIDLRTVVWQIYRRVEGGGTALEGELVLTDPSGMIGQIFYDLWLDVRRRGRPLTSSAIGTLEAKRSS